jgi:hypothetical protein
MYGEEADKPRNRLAVTAGARCHDASIPRDPAGRSPEFRARCLGMHVRPVVVRGRFADRRLSVFVIVSALPICGRHKLIHALGRARHDARRRGVRYRASDPAEGAGEADAESCQQEKPPYSRDHRVSAGVAIGEQRTGTRVASGSITVPNKTTGRALARGMQIEGSGHNTNVSPTP